LAIVQSLGDFSRGPIPARCRRFRSGSGDWRASFSHRVGWARGPRCVLTFLNMYNFVLLLHSWLRWSALIAAVGAILVTFGARDSLSIVKADRWGLALMISLDLQLLLGVVLYFGLSPFTAEAFNDFGAAMSNSGLRFWAVEHPTIMLAAVIAAHIGRLRGRKARTPEAKRAKHLLWFSIAFLLMLAATPWPGLANGRPLFRLG
jgi:hypothetical protein